MSSADTKYLPYHEPAVSTLLIYASFILLLNVVNTVLDRLLYCGLIGQILVGKIVQLGYLGLILLVYEGGLSTSLSAVRQNLWLSLVVALTGISLPIALSFILMPLLGASPVQAFAAGATMSVTSLGTTFTVLSTCNLLSTRLGTVLATAAMLDDIVGLVMLQVVTEIGASGGDIGVGTILRPVGVSLAVVFGLVVGCRYVVKPLAQRFLLRTQSVVARVPHAALVLQSLFLLGIFAGATYVGTSGLFAAWLAGATMVWWDSSCVPNALRNTASAPRKSGSEVFETSYAAVTNLLLKPFFFGSIGFAIPITQMFAGAVVWRGVVYAIIMLIAKMATGVWLVRFSNSILEKFRVRDKTKSTRMTSLPAAGRSHFADPDSPDATDAQETPRRPSPANVAVRRDPMRSGPALSNVHEASSLQRSQRPSRGEHAAAEANPRLSSKPISLYPSLLLGLAMTARGEIGFLIASVAESSGIFSDSSRTNEASEPFLVVVWAVSLCTLIGPICVGFMVRRVRALERARGEVAGRQAALGVWGVGNGI